MRGIGQAVSHGAVSIVNAFATGKGGALGIDLWTRSRVTLRDGPGRMSGFVSSDPQESSSLIVAVAEKTLEHYGCKGKVAGEIVTTSNIPIAVGLKSSSAAANATALATAAALGEEPDEDALLEIGVESSLECGVSLTGAFDDSYVSYHGGAVLADNLHRRVEKMLQIPRELRVILLIPPRKRYTGKLEKSRFDPIQRIIDIAYREALAGNVWDAMTLNGLAYSCVLQENQRPVAAALGAGALGAGLSGKGPAMVAVAEETVSQRVKEVLGTLEGRIIEASPNNTKAMIEPVGES
jgi:shikimate kinase